MQMPEEDRAYTAKDSPTVRELATVLFRRPGDIERLRLGITRKQLETWLNLRSP